MQGANDIIVVGAGPVGLTAALALRAQGLPVTVIEAEPQDRVRPGSRAIFIHREPLQTLDGMVPGLARKVGEAGNIWTGAEFTYNGRIVYKKDFKKSNYENYGTSLSQLSTERILYKAAIENGVKFMWSTPIKAVDPHDDYVKIITEDGKTIIAPYVVAADGARSTTRQCLDIPLEGNSSNTAYVIADVTSPALQSWPLKLYFHYQHKNLAGRNVMIVPFKEGWRFDLQCDPDDDVEYLASEKGCREWMSQFDARLSDVNISWVSVYRFRQLVARDFADAKRRVLLIGEAAHLFAPFGGRGLNSGIMDAALAASAIRSALVADSRESAIARIDHFARERRDAALFNRSIAATALERLAPSSISAQTKRWLMAQLARWFGSAGRWLTQGAAGVSHGRHPGATIY